MGLRLRWDRFDKYDIFKDLGKYTVDPVRHKRIRVHLVYEVKHNGCHKDRLVANGYLTDISVENIYSGVISLCDIRLIVFLSKINKMKTWVTDIGNAYLEKIHLRKLTSYQGLDLVIGRAKLSLLPRNDMAFNILAL